MRKRPYPVTPYARPPRGEAFDEDSFSGPAKRHSIRSSIYNITLDEEGNEEKHLLNNKSFELSSITCVVAAAVCSNNLNEQC